MKPCIARPFPSTPRRRHPGRRLLAAALTAATAFCAVAAFDANAAGDTLASASHAAGAKLHDMTLITEAKAALVQASGLDSGDVHVSVKDGNVTLTGSVPDESQRPLAIAAVKRVDGVRAVQDQLTIHAR
ncbi:BON domain-containing protein [Burkholderia glumae]|uniref:BON domain-containing protein n=1 Tax=Burkholderia glumae TaxID=337 RepID=UPI002151867E|nr:BON domain-containing protein [Burkholderia glumae]UVS95416.1 BON domain-containing protein [Burkholderia glumae]